jgi:hypothetical protein
MSSTMISATVWPPADHPCSSSVGVNTLTFEVPCGRFVADR